MAGYCTSVRLYFHEPQASENTAQECNIQPYCLLNHQIIGASVSEPHTSESNWDFSYITRNTHAQSMPRAEEYPEICK